MPAYKDQLNRIINLPAAPKRIISIVPSQTELLFYLGLSDEVIGITKFCIHPADKFNSITKVGGTKKLDMELIKQLNPDLIIANKEENERGQVEELIKHYPVWISDISNLTEALDMIEQVGELVGKREAATRLNNLIKNEFDQLSPPAAKLKVAYFIWRKPYMVAGNGTFINDLLQKCGVTNVFEKDRYPEITADELIAANPDVVFLSSEPYPFKQKHIEEFRELLPNAKIVLVDGEMFSWYGNRLLYAPKYFIELLTQLKSMQSGSNR